VTLAAKPIPRVLSRHNLLMGGDRELVLLSALCCVGLPVLSMTITACVAAIVLWLLSLAALRAMAKADPQMRQVYQRSRIYADYYPPFSRPYYEKPPGLGTKLLQTVSVLVGK
jgi:type IV secretion system protein TrbD